VTPGIREPHVAGDLYRPVSNIRIEPRNYLGFRASGAYADTPTAVTSTPIYRDSVVVGHRHYFEDYLVIWNPLTAQNAHGTGQSTDQWLNGTDGGAPLLRIPLRIAIEPFNVDVISVLADYDGIHPESDVDGFVENRDFRTIITPGLTPDDPSTLTPGSDDWIWSIDGVRPWDFGIFHPGTGSTNAPMAIDSHNFRAGGDNAHFIIQNSGRFPITGLTRFEWASLDPTRVVCPPGCDEVLSSPSHVCVTVGYTGNLAHPFNVMGPTLFTDRHGFGDGVTIGPGNVVMPNMMTDYIVPYHAGDGPGYTNFRVTPRENLPPGVHTDILFIRNPGGFEIAIPFRIHVEYYDFTFTVEEFDPREHGFNINLSEDIRIIRLQNDSVFSIHQLVKRFLEVPRCPDTNEVLPYYHHVGPRPGQNPPDEVYLSPIMPSRYFNIEGGNFFNSFNHDGYFVDEDGFFVHVYPAENITGIRVPRIGNTMNPDWDNAFTLTPGLNPNDPPVRVPVSVPGEERSLRLTSTISYIPANSAVYLIVRMNPGLDEGHFFEYLHLWNRFHFEAYIPLNFTVMHNQFSLVPRPDFIDFGQIYFGAPTSSFPSPISIELSNMGNTDIRYFTNDAFSVVANAYGIWGDPLPGMGTSRTRPFDITRLLTAGQLGDGNPTFAAHDGRLVIPRRSTVQNALEISVRNFFSDGWGPWGPGMYTATLQINTINEASSPPNYQAGIVEVQVQFEVLPPSAYVQATHIDFERAGVGYTQAMATARQQQITVQNLVPEGGLSGVRYSFYSGGANFNVTGIPFTYISNTPGGGPPYLREYGFIGGSSGHFTIEPALGLEPGTHTAEIDIDFDHSGPDFPTRITLSFIVDPHEGLMSPSAPEWPARPAGYAPAQVPPQRVYIENTGRWPFYIRGAVSVPANFVMTTGPNTTGPIPAGGSAFIYVQPAHGLAVGSYIGPLSVVVGNSGSAAHAVTLMSTLMFTVSEPGISATLYPTPITWPYAGFGYNDREWRTVTITNTGDRGLLNINAAFLGSNFEIYGADSNGSYTITHLAPFVRPNYFDDTDPPVPNVPTTYTIRIRPVTGLNPGTYNDTLRFTAAGMSVTASVGFEVRTPNATLTPVFHSWGETDAGYAMRPLQEFTLTNTGPGRLTNLSGFVSNLNFEIVSHGPETIEEGDTGVWTVRPRLGLVPNRYTAQLEIRGAFEFSITTGDVYEYAARPGLEFVVNPARAIVSPAIRD